MKRKNGKILFLFLTMLFLISSVLVFSVAAVDRNDIISISVGKLTLIKNYDGEIVRETGKADYFCYDTSNPSSVTVRFRNGKTLTDTLAAFEAYFGESAEISDSQSAENPWKTGTYKVSYSFMGHTGEYDAEVTETPVEKITVKDVSLIFKGDGYYDTFSSKKPFYYHSSPVEMTVYFKDGTVKKGTADSFYELTGYPVNVYDDQEKDPWGVGRYKCRVNYMGVDAYYFVEVNESPVKSILVDEMVLYEGIDGVYGRDLGSKYVSSDFYYNAKPDKITVFYKDGTAFTGSVEEIQKETGYDVIYDTEKKWEYGKQTAQVSFLGVTTKFIVNVKENPIVNVRLSKKPDKISYYEGELFDFSGSKLSVAYLNGKAEEIELVQNYETGVIDCYLGVLGKTVSVNSFVEVNKNSPEISFDFADTFFTVDVSVKKENIRSIELSTDENDFPEFVFRLSDGSKKAVAVYNAVYGNYNEMKPGEIREAVLITSLGDFSVSVIKDIEGYAVRFSVYGEEESVTSNFCENVNWAESAMTEKARLIYNFYGKTDAYTGLVESENIDSLLLLAALGSNKGKAKEIHENYRIYTSTEIQKCVIDFFAIDGIDIAISKKFDAKTNTIRIDIPDNVYRDTYFYETGVRYPVKYEFKGGFFIVSYTFADGKSMEVCADSNGRIMSYKVKDAVLHKHVMVTIPGRAPTYLKTGLTDGVKCSSCGEVITSQKTVAKLVLGKTSKIIAEQDTSSVKLTWAKVKGASGYEIFYKTSTSSWISASSTSHTTVTYTKLPSGKKYVYAVRAYAIENGKIAKATAYTTIETATQPVKPSKVISKQNDSAIKLSWSAVDGVTGYRLYYKTAAGWKRLGETAKTSATFTALKQGTRYIFAIRPYIKTKSSVVWSVNYATYVAATKPAMPTLKATSPSGGKLCVTIGKVSGAEAYQLYYKSEGGTYKLYKNYSKAGLSLIHI